MPDHQIKYCRSCGDPIVWMRTTNGKPIPVEPDDIDPDDELFDPQKHKSHFSNCPHADEHRRR